MKLWLKIAIMGCLAAVAAASLAVLFWFHFYKYSAPSAVYANDEDKAFAVLSGHSSCVLSLAYSPDGAFLASSSGTLLMYGPKEDISVRLWDASTLQTSCILPSRHGMENLCFSPDGTRLGGTSGSNITIWNVALGIEERRFGANETVRQLAFSPTGAIGYSTSTYVEYKSTSYVRMIAGESEQTASFSGQISSLQFSGVGNELWTGEMTGGNGVGEIRIWDADKMQLIEALSLHQGPVLLSLSKPSGKGASANYGWIYIWDTAKRTIILRIPWPGGASSLAFSPDGQILAVGKNEIDDLPGPIVLLDASDGKALATVRCPKGSVHDLVFSPDGNYLASSGWLDKRILIWDVKKLLWKGAGKGPEKSAMLQKGKGKGKERHAPNG